MTLVPELEGYWRITCHKPWEVLSAALGTVTEKSFLLTAIVITKEGMLPRKVNPSVSPAISHFADMGLGCAHGSPLILFKGSI